jgi:hypothetical protein
VLWLGYLSPYPYWFDDPTFVDAPDAVAPPSLLSPVLPPETAPTGGLQLDVEPRRSQVYVDGFYAGVVDDFSGYYHHLDLPAGPHRLDFVLSGYEPLTITLVVSPGRTTTFRGSLTWTTSGR